MNKKELLLQFVRFGAVGFTSILVGYGAYTGTLSVLRYMHLWPNTDVFVGQVMMFVISVGWSFIWNNKLVFQRQKGEECNLWLVCLKTYATYAFTSLFLSELLLHLWVNILDVNEYLAPLLSIFITGPINFVIQKFWAFKSCCGEKRAKVSIDGSVG